MSAVAAARAVASYRRPRISGASAWIIPHEPQSAPRISMNRLSRPSGNSVDRCSAQSARVARSPSQPSRRNARNVSPGGAAR